MKNIIRTAIIALLAFSSVVIAQDCINVIGSAVSRQVSKTQNIGTIEFNFYNSETGMYEGRAAAKLNGMITGADEEGFLSTYTISKITGDYPFTIITVDDYTEVTGRREGCYLPVSKRVTEVVWGSGLMQEIDSIDLYMNGKANSSEREGCAGLPNIFDDISGQMCFDR